MDVGLSDGAKRKYDSFTGRSSAYTALGAEGTNAEYYYYQRGENGTVVSIPISEKISTDISTRVGSMYGKEMQKAEPRKSFPDGLKKFCEMAVAGSLDSSGSTSDQAGSSSTLGTLTGPSADARQVAASPTVHGPAAPHGGGGGGGSALSGDAATEATPTSSAPPPSADAQVRFAKKSKNGSEYDLQTCCFPPLTRAV